jgi:hypothetical protein
MERYGKKGVSENCKNPEIPNEIKGRQDLF